MIDIQGFQGHLVWFQGFQGPADTLVHVRIFFKKNTKFGDWMVDENNLHFLIWLAIPSMVRSVSTFSCFSSVWFPEMPSSRMYSTILPSTFNKKRNYIWWLKPASYPYNRKPRVTSLKTVGNRTMDHNFIITHFFMSFIFWTTNYLLKTSL